MSSKASGVLTLILSILFFFAVKHVISQISQHMESFPEILQLAVYTSLPIAGGLIALSFGYLLGTFIDSEDSVTVHLLQKISEDPARNFALGFLITAYLSLIRPQLALNVPFLPYMEWVAIALTVYTMYTLIRFSAEEFYIGSESRGWKKHTQEIRRETGLDLIRLTSVMEQFVNYGRKELLLVYLTLHLYRLGETEEDIIKKLSPIINYREKPSMHRFSLLAFPWMKRKLAVKNKENRKTLLKTLLENIERSE
jgi:hypothetical protein